MPENIEHVSNLSADGNHFSATTRLPLDPSGKPVAKQGALTVARLQGDAHGNLLTEALKNDEHIGPCVPHVLPDGTVSTIPSKDNSLEVEGLSVSGNRVFLGLRGTGVRAGA